MKSQQQNEPVFKILEESCKNSYSCIRVCPVRAIEVKTGEEHPRILPDRCIGCGSCLLACTPEAIAYRDGKEAAKDLLASGSRVAAIVAPSISAEFEDITDYRKFVQMIRSLGFDYVHEESFGVDLIAHAYKKLLSEASGKYYISANCPAIVQAVEKYRPELISNLAPLVSPMTAMAMVVNQMYQNDVHVVHIGPCIDTKEEAELYEDDDRKIDAVLTFKELRQLFDEFNIQEKSVSYSDFDPPMGRLGSLYPIPNGLLQAAGIPEDILSSRIITAAGKEDSLKALEQFEKYIDTIHHHFNLFYCKGCIDGPGMSRRGERYRRRAVVRDYAEKRLNELVHQEWEKERNKWSDNLDLSRNFRNRDQRLPAPPEGKIREVMQIIDKDNNREEINCGSCGYRSCREFATTVAQGLATPEMCHTYNLRNKQKYIESLRQTNRKLAETKAALKESEETAQKEKGSAREAHETTRAMLEKLPSGVVIADRKMKVVHCNKSFIDLLGEEAESVAEIIPGLAGADLKSLLPFQIYNLFTFVLKDNQAVVNRDIELENRLLNISIFPIRKGVTVGGLFRDMYSPEVQSEEVIHRVTEVIEKNLEMVQQIGFLLGEGASETERMLHSIIESYRNPGQKEDNS